MDATFESLIASAIKLGFPMARLEFRGAHVLAYEGGKLAADVALFSKAKWAFVHYGYGGRAEAERDVSGMMSALRQAFAAEGWTYAVKGGNPLLSGQVEPRGLRDFSTPRAADLRALRDLAIGYIAQKYPDARVVDAPVYAGLGWVLATDGADALGVRDLDVNLFLAPGSAARSLAWTVQKKMMWNETERIVDLYWNVLAPGQTPAEYIAAKAAAAKSGRWLTVPERPWISLISGDMIWKGKM